MAGARVTALGYSGLPAGTEPHQTAVRSFERRTGFVHVMWDDVRVNIGTSLPVARRDPLVAALFGAGAVVEKACS